MLFIWSIHFPPDFNLRLNLDNNNTINDLSQRYAALFPFNWPVVYEMKEEKIQVAQYTIHKLQTQTEVPLPLSPSHLLIFLLSFFVLEVFWSITWFRSFDGISLAFAPENKNTNTHIRHLDVLQRFGRVNLLLYVRIDSMLMLLLLFFYFLHFTQIIIIILKQFRVFVGSSHFPLCRHLLQSQLWHWTELDTHTSHVYVLRFCFAVCLLAQIENLIIKVRTSHVCLLIVVAILFLCMCVSLWAMMVDGDDWRFFALFTLHRCVD